MKPNRSLQQWLSSAVVGVALVASPSLGLAANLVYTFDTDTQGWGANNAATTVAWDGTQNRGPSGGSLKCTLDPTVGNTLNPAISVDFDTLKYFDVEFDILVDPSSSMDGAGTYGNVQIGDFDSTWAWHSAYYGNIGTNAGTWKHVKLAFQTPYQPRINLQILLQASNGTFTNNVTVYIDNVVFQDGSPGNLVTLEDFAWPEECVPDKPGGSWGPGAVWSYDNTLYAGGALKAHFDYGSTNTGWQDGAIQIADYPSSWDPAKFTKIAFDLYLDAPHGLPSYGQVEMQYYWSWAGIIPAVALSEANVGKWVRYTNSLNSVSSNPQGIVIHPGGNNVSGVFNYYFKNIQVWQPSGPPRMATVRQEESPTGQGVEFTMNAKNNQWQRDALCVPATTPDYSWVSRTPLSYSFTIATFPDAVKHAGFEVHLFIVNESTVPGGNGQWNETYGACDWNAADLVKFTIENKAGGGVTVRMAWKTGLPGANPPDANRVVDATGTTAVGTWTLTFDTDTTGTITGPGGFTASFTLPDVVKTQFDPNGAAALSFLQFGMGQNDSANNNHNYNASGVFSAISMSGGLYAFSESFPGPALTSGGTAWRTTGNAVQFAPNNTAVWVSWSLPDDGFRLLVSPNLNSWADAGVTGSYVNGGNRAAAVPASKMPSGSDTKAFFRVISP
jgi:hypothetical protein